MGFWQSALEDRMRILVTGNLGFVGSHLTEILVTAGHEVIGCDLSLFPDAVCSELAVPSVQLIRDFRTLTKEELNGIDAIAHLAGISNDPMGDLNPGLTLKINGEGSVQLAAVAKAAGVKIFAFASSCSIYGSSGDKPRTEKDSTNPLSEYATSKLFAEEGLAKIASINFHVYLLRNATAYGASPVLRTDLVVNDLSAGMCANGIAEIKSDGSPWRPLIHCRDMARAFQEFIEKDPIQVSGEPVNIGFEAENFQVKDVGSGVQSTWPEGKVLYLPGAVSDPRDYKVNFSLLKSILPNFQPENPLSRGIPELRKLLESINYSKNDRESKRYVRLNELQKRIGELE
jgi:nucleoside-diphosphate-sugar epimerase